MKIKIAILDPDKGYLSRFAARFNIKYAEEAELHFFTELDMALADLKKNRIDVFLASDEFEIDMTAIPKRCVFAYLVGQKGVDTLDGQHAICKFQKGDQIFRQIQSLYADVSGASDMDTSGQGARVIAFGSASGGVGSSTVAAACAMHYAQRMKSVLYLNLEQISSTELFFSGEGQANFRDVITALKSPMVNLKMKLDSCTRRDPSNVAFFASADVALDMLELETEDTIKLLKQLRFHGGYDAIIVDVDFSLKESLRQVLRETDAIILVSDGTAVSNKKTERAYAALTCVESDQENPLQERIRLLYNRVSSNNGQAVALAELRSIGGAPRYTGADSREVALQLAQMDFFDNI